MVPRFGRVAGFRGETVKLFGPRCGSCSIIHPEHGQGSFKLFEQFPSATITLFWASGKYRDGAPEIGLACFLNYLCNAL